MNKLIEQLIKQSYGHEDSNGNRSFNKELFAELIVRECAKVSERTGALNEADFEGEMIADALKEHFGVK